MTAPVARPASSAPRSAGRSLASRCAGAAGRLAPALPARPAPARPRRRRARRALTSSPRSRCAAAAADGCAASTAPCRRCARPSSPPRFPAPSSRSTSRPATPSRPGSCWLASTRAPPSRPPPPARPRCRPRAPPRKLPTGSSSARGSCSQQNYISQAALDRAEAQYKSTQAEVAAQRAGAGAARTQSGFYVVRAPYAGVVADVAVVLGDMAMPGRPLLTLYDPAALRVSVNVPQSAAAASSRGPPLRLELPGPAGRSHRRAVTRVQVLPTVDPATHTLELRLDLPAGLAGAAPGMFARAWLPTRAGGRRRLYVPAAGRGAPRRAERRLRVGSRRQADAAPGAASAAPTATRSRCWPASSAGERVATRSASRRALR